MLSTCQVLFKNLKGSEFNVLVSRTASLGNNFMSSFFKREMAPKKVISLFVGVPLAGNNNETFCIYTGSFWVQGDRLSLGSRKVDLTGTKKQRSDITSRTQLVKIIFCQPKLKLELIIHKVLHVPHPPLTF